MGLVRAVQQLALRQAVLQHDVQEHVNGVQTHYQHQLLLQRLHQHVLLRFLLHHQDNPLLELGHLILGRILAVFELQRHDV